MFHDYIILLNNTFFLGAIIHGDIDDSTITYYSLRHT